MSSKDIYLDHISTTPIDEEVLKTYELLLKKYFANSSSIHALGHEVNRLEEKSRTEVLDLLRLKNYRVLFTSGATEANNLAIKGTAFHHLKKPGHIITTQVEHASVLEACRQLEAYFDFDVTYLDVDQNGQISLKQLKDSLREDTILVSILAVNNELGSVIDPGEWAPLVKENSRALVHVDMVQALTKFDFDLSCVDMITLSAHKLNGIKGSGALIIRDHLQLVPLLSGGSQEYGLRAGTSNAPANIVLAKTIRLALEKQERLGLQLRDHYQYLRKELEALDGVTINSPHNGTPYILNVSVEGLTSEVLLNGFNQKNIYVSAVSTCNDNQNADSYVLEAIGLNKKQRQSSIRIGLSLDTCRWELEEFIKILKEIIDKYAIKI